VIFRYFRLIINQDTNFIDMKKVLFTLTMVALVGGGTFAATSTYDGDPVKTEKKKKSKKKSKKKTECCSKTAAKSCCAKKKEEL